MTFVTITGRVNVYTGDMIPIEPPAEIHEDDLESWEQSWWPIDELGWRIELAALAAKRAGA